MVKVLDELGSMIAQKRSDCVLAYEVSFDELNIEVSPSNIVPVIEFLKNDQRCKFSTLVDITAVDYPDREKRFEIVYHLLSMYQNQRLRLRMSVGVEDTITSIVDIHPAANWFEREIYDMFGVLFSGHPDLRRLLTDYGFKGHPLRKDFPTTGYTELRYDELEKRVVYEPVSLVQEYRQFDFMSPWEGAKYVIPDDEKLDAK